MPGKAGHSKRKYTPLGKKKKSQRVAPATAVPEPPVSSSEVKASSGAVQPPVASATPAHYPYIHSELRRIGILAVVIMAILVVMSLVLS